MTDADRVAALKQAYADGKAAEVGASNPYAGPDYLLARCWRIGYHKMLTDAVNRSRAMQTYLRGQAPNN